MKTDHDSFAPTVSRGDSVATPDENAAFTARVRKEFEAFVSHPSFPCLGAKAAFNAGSYVLSVFGELGSAPSANELSAALTDFVHSDLFRGSEYATFVAVFRRPLTLSEVGFERLLWLQLQRLHALDEKRFAWDASVASDPADPRFSFSFAGRALYVVGMHQGSSRLARRFPWPALIFNPHAQFEKLRDGGKWTRMQQTIRSRDVALQGTANPMLSDFGEASEARQYSGRAVEKDWQPPFVAAPPAKGAGRCPFGH